MCKLLTGVEANWQLVHHPRPSPNNRMTLEQWNSVFLLYSVAAHAVKQVLPANLTVDCSTSDCLSVARHLAELRQLLLPSDFGTFLKYLKPIEHRREFIDHFLLLAS